MTTCFPGGQVCRFAWLTSMWGTVISRSGRLFLLKSLLLYLLKFGFDRPSGVSNWCLHGNLELQFRNSGGRLLLKILKLFVVPVCFGGETEFLSFTF